MGAIRATVAAVLVLISAAATAEDCFTGARVISSRANVPNLVAGPSAWSGSVLAVANLQEGATGPAWIGVYDELTQPLTADRQVVSDARTLIALVWNGSEFGLFYRTTNQRLQLQRLTMMGTPVGSPVVVTPRAAAAGDRVDVRWSPVHDAYVVASYVVSGSARGLYITMVATEGTQLSDRPVQLSLDTASPVAVSVTDAGVVGVFFITVNNLLTMARVSGVNDVPVSLEIGPGGVGEVVVAARGEQFVVARMVEADSRFVVRWMVVDTSHQVVKGDALLVTGTTGDAYPQALLVTPDEIALSYLDSSNREDTLDDTLRLRRFSITGTLIGDTAFAPSDSNALRAVSPHPFVYTGTVYLVAALREGPDRLSSYLVRYCPLRVEILAPRVVLLGSTVTFTPSPSGGVPGYVYSWAFSHQAAVEKLTVTPRRTYSEAGTYSVTVTATDTVGVVTRSTFTFEVVYPRRRAVRP